MKVLLFFLTLWLSMGTTLAQTPYQNAIRKARAGVRTAAQTGNYRAVAQDFAAAFALNPDIASGDRYNAACMYAMAGDKDQAFAYLSQIVGISEFDLNQLTNDSDLASLRTDRRWAALVARLKAVKPKTLTLDEQRQDFDLLVSALKEAHTGLYWYAPKPRFDSLCAAQRARLRPGQSALGFYTVVAPLVAAPHEAHTSLRPDPKSQAYLRFHGRFFPLYLKFLNGQVYVLNDYGGHPTKGQRLTSLNGRPMDELWREIRAYEPADGFNSTGPDVWLSQNAKFNHYYARLYPQPSSFTVTVADPQTDRATTYRGLLPVSQDSLEKGYAAAVRGTLDAPYAAPGMLQFDPVSRTAVLAFHSFDPFEYKAAGLDFKTFVADAFRQVREQGAEQLVLDLRRNEGGQEGFEDDVLAHLTDQDYLKYRYVECSGLTYSFYRHTNYRDRWQHLDSLLAREHYRDRDGRVLRRPGILPHTKPQPNPFGGAIYVLTSGLTYSGGSECAALLKNYTNAVFVGEETGGGYYGNTSGITLTLTLPHSGVPVRIPLLKFVVNTLNTSVPFGHGVLPDFPVVPSIEEFLRGEDTPLNTVKELIARRRAGGPTSAAK